MSMNITFRKEPKETGARAITHFSQKIELRRDKKTFGYIIPPSPYRDYWLLQVAMVTTDGFRFMNFKNHFASEQECKDYVKENTNRILELNLFYFD